MSRECSGGLLGVIWLLDMPRYSQVDSLGRVFKLLGRSQQPSCPLLQPSS